MSNKVPGIGVMLHAMSGSGSGGEVVARAIGKKIVAMSLSEDALRIEVEGGPKFIIEDKGQSCCENRYMRSDDNPEDFIGQELRAITLRDTPSISVEYGEEHEIQFLVVEAGAGAFTVSSHNEHNGYYGGFALVASEVE